MVAALTRIFGVHNLSLAEDVVQDAFYRALEVWKFRGVPENPSAWLMRTAKNRALDLVRRDRNIRRFAPDIESLLSSEWTLAPFVAGAFEEHSIQDDELRMMFSCCHPDLPEIAQVALILNVCCGFSISEIASAFLVSQSAMEKRIARAKKVFTHSKRLFELESGADLSARLDSVQRAVYLLFNEGYHGASSQASVRADLCYEALRLGDQLLGHRLAATPATQALCALMAFNAARLRSRVDQNGHLASLLDQDRTLWDIHLIELGHRRLSESATGCEASSFHFEAAIASIHASARNFEETDWSAIVSLYDVLLSIQPSPVVALNRAIAIAQAEGPERGLEEIHAIVDGERLLEYPFFKAALGELEMRTGRLESAAKRFQAAMALARNPSERDFLQERLRVCRQTSPSIV
jgi:RNA polymerase sigma-70 factor (ECF subfamily)